jgi:hypothetical protein
MFVMLLFFLESPFATFILEVSWRGAGLEEIEAVTAFI